MPKQLLIVRHAKSDWNDFNLRDFDRPLNDRGLRNAPEMAKRLVKQGLIPQKLVSSPALRALSTAQHFATVLKFDKSKISYKEEIYEARTATLLALINGFKNKYDYVALFGHNPGVSNLTALLVNQDLHDLPTCGMALIEFPFDDWALVSQGTGELKLFDYPKSDFDL